MWKLNRVVEFVWCALLWHRVIALENGLARTPPMGWMSWLRYGCTTDCGQYPDECISDKLFRNIADRMVSEGYKDVGYEYIIIDDCWREEGRDINGRLVPDLKRFPNGMKSLADYIHAKGLKLGIFWRACAASAEDIHRMAIDAQTFADWEVDYVKLVTCAESQPNVPIMHLIFSEFGHSLRETGRPIVYSCSCPAYEEMNLKPSYELLAKTCNQWRIWHDIQVSWESVKDITQLSAAAQARIQPLAGPGHWNDPDVLTIGNGGLSLDQSKAQMAIWAILAAPLMMSNDLKVRADFKNILQNRKIIEVNQDPLGIQGLRISNENQIEIWARKITPVIGNSKSFAIAFLNYRYDSFPYSINISLDQLGLTHSLGYVMTDLYDENKDFEPVAPGQNLTMHINSSGILFYKFTPRRGILKFFESILSNDTAAIVFINNISFNLSVGHE